MTHHDTDVVSTLRLSIADRVGQDRFELWFGTGTQLFMEGQRVFVEVANQFTLDWLRNNFRREIETAVCDVIGPDAAIEFRLNAQLARNASPKASKPAQVSTQSVGAPSKAARPASSQRTSRRRFARLEEFVVGDSNRVAYASASMTARQLGSVSPLFFYGPSGVGKSHLLESIYYAVGQLPERHRSIYLSAEQFTSYFLEALQGKGLPSFRRRYRDVDLLVVDDVQFFLGKRATQGELQHTIDTLLRDGRQVAFSCDRPPSQLTDLGPELVTRFSGGLVCAVQPPDFDTRVEILKNWSNQQKLKIPETVLTLIASRVSDDVRQLRGALNRIHATSQALDESITLEMAEHSLVDVLRNTRQLFRLDEVERAICEIFELDRGTLKSSSRSRSVTQPRMLAMWLARRYTRSALSEIGDHFGRKSHATVISAQKTVDKWIKEGQTVHMPDRDHNVDDAIQQLTARMRAG